MKIEVKGTCERGFEGAGIAGSVTRGGKVGNEMQIGCKSGQTRGTDDSSL